METDFLDDINRPGAVLGPKTIPKRTHQLANKLIESGYSKEQINEIMENIHSNWPQILYSWKGDFSFGVKVIIPPKKNSITQKVKK